MNLSSNLKFHPFIDQQSEEWFRLRKGKITASNASRIITPTGKPSSQQDEYIIELCAECVYPDEPDSWTGNSHTDRGNAFEGAARDMFAERSGLEVATIGFIECEGLALGCSPDGMAIENGSFVAGVEIKCPLAKNHASYLLSGGVPDKYRPQVHFSMAITGKPWWFVSYCERMEPHIVLVEPDGYTAKMRAAIAGFVERYQNAADSIIAKLVRKEVK